MTALEYISTSALSLTLSGNTGVGPFLTLFVVGVAEKYDPTLLHMEGWVEKILASWPGLAVFGLLTILEFVGKCVPVVDQVIDSVLVFVMPLLSVVGSSASFGLFTPPDDDGRRLEEDDSGALTFLKVVLCATGVGLAVSVHLGKMLVRLMGEGCCCAPCITVVEEVWVVCSVVICIFIVPIAIGAALLLLVLAGFGLRKWWRKRQEKKKAAASAEAPAEGAVGAVGGTDGGGQNKREDEEQQNKGAPQKSTEGLVPDDDKREPLLP